MQCYVLTNCLRANFALALPASITQHCLILLVAAVSFRSHAPHFIIHSSRRWNHSPPQCLLCRADTKMSSAVRWKCILQTFQRIWQSVVFGGLGLILLSGEPSWRYVSRGCWQHPRGKAVKQLYCHFTCNNIIPALKYGRLVAALPAHVAINKYFWWDSRHCNCLQGCHSLLWQSPKAVMGGWRVRAGPAPSPPPPPPAVRVCCLDRVRSLLDWSVHL